MTIGIGTDLVEIKRIEEKLQKNNGFIDMVFSNNEIQYCQSMRFPAQHFAARFAAKESLLKAVGKGLLLNISLTKIEVCNDAHGKPYFNFDSDTNAIITKEIGTMQWVAHVSLSHTQSMASAFVILATI